jgi:Flp pilus assembly protein TadG
VAFRGGWYLYPRDTSRGELAHLVISWNFSRPGRNASRTHSSGIPGAHPQYQPDPVYRIWFDVRLSSSFGSHAKVRGLWKCPFDSIGEVITMPIRRKQRESGNSIIEVALMSPWIFFLFVGVFDLGFYAYAVICTENAARAAATQTASSANVGVGVECDAAWNELKGLPNVASLPQNCTQAPVTVTRKTLCTQATVQPSTIVCTAPGCADCGGTSDPLGQAASSQVSVTYQSGLFIPIPGVLTNQLNITRIVEARIIAE